MHSTQRLLFSFSSLQNGKDLNVKMQLIKIGASTKNEGLHQKNKL